MHTPVKKGKGKCWFKMEFFFHTTVSKTENIKSKYIDVLVNPWYV